MKTHTFAIKQNAAYNKATGFVANEQVEERLDWFAEPMKELLLDATKEASVAQAWKWQPVSPLSSWKLWFMTELYAGKIPH